MGEKIDDMPKKGYIYKLCINENDENFYIGSTQRRLVNRLWEHRYDIKKKRHSKSKYEFFEKDIDNLQIILIEECFNTLEELKFRERHYIDKFKCKINELCPIRNKEELKAYNKVYYYINKKEIIEKRCKKEICNVCGYITTHQYLPTHQKTNKCKNNKIYNEEN